tara:strand:- start:26691 stop:27299 length:609 start_codon:yes stop_codon:yes gene_type:complete
MGKSTRNLWTEKLSKEPTENVPHCREDALDIGPSFKGTVLGIDPSLRGTGLALLDFNTKSAPHLIYSETLRLKPELTMAECLASIFVAVTHILETRSVDHVAFEQTIFVQNQNTAQALGAAKGAAMAAVGLKEKPVFEYPPLRIKQAVVGFGKASKEQVAKMVMQLLKLDNELPFDESDAAGVAVCHAFTHKEKKAVACSKA